MHLIFQATLILALSLTISWGPAVFGQQAPTSAGMCEFLLNTLDGTLSALMDDGEFRQLARQSQAASECRARGEDNCDFSTESFTSKDEVLQWFEEKYPAATKIDSDLIDQARSQRMYRLGAYGTTKAMNLSDYSLEGFRQHFKENLPQRYRKTASQAFEQMLDLDRIIEWIVQLRHDVVTRMWEAGHREKKDFLNHDLIARYMDHILAIRAKHLGFSVTDENKPWPVYSYSQFRFARNLALGRVFLDWTGSMLMSGANDAPHGVRGHLLQMVYLAEHVDGLVGLVKFAGRTNDYHGIWAYLFDNAENTQTPFWTGFWLEAFQLYLRIPE